jgi:hypothetical protein
MSNFLSPPAEPGDYQWIYIVAEGYTVISSYLLSGLPDSGSSSFVQQGESYFAGLGVIFYPIQLIQLGASLGYSSTMYFFNEHSNLRYGVFDTNFLGSFGWSISGAIDFGKNNHGFLIGLRYSGAVNRKYILHPGYYYLDGSYAYFDLLSSYFSIFVKYAYRKKIPT